MEIGWINSSEEVHNYVDRLTEILINICDKNLPKIKRTKRRILWLDDNLKDMQKEKKRTRRKLERMTNPEIREHILKEYREFLKQYKHALITSKRKSIREFFSEQTPDSVWKKIYSWNKTLDNKNITTHTIKTDKGWTGSAEETANCLLKTYRRQPEAKENRSDRTFPI